MNLSKPPTTCSRAVTGSGTTLALWLLLATPLRSHAQSSDNPDSQGQTTETNRLVGGGAVAARALANAVNDPTAPVTLVQFREIVAPSVPGYDSPANVLQIEPVFPIFPTRLLPFEQLVKMTLPVPTSPNPSSQTGLGDISLFDLVTIDQSWTVGAEVAWVNGPFSLQGELVQSVISEQSGGSANLGGFYAFASWYLTGESRPYDTQAGAFKRLYPRHNFQLGRGGWGAVELTARFSHTDLTEGNVHGGRLDLLMSGVNWYLTPHVKWMFNYGFGHVAGGLSQGNMNIFQTRIGVDF